MNTLLKLQTYMTGRKALLPGALAVSALSTIAGMSPYIFIWFIVRELFNSGSAYSTSFVITCAWWAAGTAVGSVILYFIALSLSHLAAFRAEANIRKYAMQKIVRMPLGFFDGKTSGRIRKIIDENASITHGFLAHQMPDLAGTIIMPLTALVLVFVFDWRLGLVCLVPIIFSMILMGFMMGKKGRHFMKIYMDSLEEMNTEAVEYVRGIPVVKVFQQTVFSFKNFHRSIMKYREMVSEYTKLWQKPMSAYIAVINGFVFFLVPAAILLVNSSGDYAGVILNLFLYVLITPVFSQSIMRSMYLTQALGQAREAVTRVEDLTDAEQLPVPAEPKSPAGYDISFRNVSFMYPGTDRMAIENISFNIPRGKTVALVGASGGGKTTIARLVPRFRDVTGGEVCIGGVNVKDIDPEELMNSISFVFQNTRLFKTTLLENIRYGNPEADSEQIVQAVEAAQCWEMIDKLPDGLKTKIGTEGTWLSGGEQQRIVLARAILKNAPVVVLDEATAFTDPENEHLIQEALKKLAKGKTVLMIAHRLTSVKDADTVLVIDKGKIAEQGTHHELLKKQGVYSNIWNEYQQSVQWTIGKEACNA
ncbi:MAG: ABC transporter ATP-binding protein [Desulfobacteraceae bacterium]